MCCQGNTLDYLLREDVCVCVFFDCVSGKVCVVFLVSFAFLDRNDIVLLRVLLDYS